MKRMESAWDRYDEALENIAMEESERFVSQLLPYEVETIYASDSLCAMVEQGCSVEEIRFQIKLCS
jgi:hypothetical protein